MLQVGVDDSVFETLSLNDFQGVCGHPRCMIVREFTHNSTDACVNTVVQVDRYRSTTVVHFHDTCGYLAMFPFCCSYR